MLKEGNEDRFAAWKGRGLTQDKIRGYTIGMSRRLTDFEYQAMASRRSALDDAWDHDTLLREAIHLYEHESPTPKDKRANLRFIAELQGELVTQSKQSISISRQPDSRFSQLTTPQLIALANHLLEQEQLASAQVIDGQLVLDTPNTPSP